MRELAAITEATAARVPELKANTSLAPLLLPVWQLNSCELRAESHHRSTAAAPTPPAGVVAAGEAKRGEEQQEQEEQEQRYRDYGPRNLAGRIGEVFCEEISQVWKVDEGVAIALGALHCVTERALVSAYRVRSMPS